MSEFFGIEGFTIKYMSDKLTYYTKGDEVRVEAKSTPELYTVYDSENNIYQKKFGNRWSWKVKFPRPIFSDLVTLDQLNGTEIDFKPHDENPTYYKCYMWYYYDHTIPHSPIAYIEIERKTLQLTTIDTSYLTITNPNGEEVLSIGDPFTITWIYNNIPEEDEVKIILYKGGSPSSVIESNLANSGSYLWDTSGLLAGEDYQIYIETVLDSSINDLSDGYFELSNP